jgi:uncharacterized membrane protein
VTFALTARAIALAAPLPYLTQSLAKIAADDGAIAEHYLHQPLVIRVALYAHLSASAVALLLTPILASSRIRERRPRVHRRVGYVTFVAITIGGLFGLIIASVSYAGLSGTLGFGLLSILWVHATWRAAAAARNHKYREHRHWAIRTMAFTYAAVTLRLWLIVLISAQTPSSLQEERAAFDNAYVIVPFLCWIPNVIAVEWWIRTKGRKPWTPKNQLPPGQLDTGATPVTRRT